ncbi:MAG: hypothetical protein M1838_004860 [Thelocarpon superellum]|nr:MAG: hypothetical protein M1838_004860 [Thelocarpon superellum]
MRRTHPPSGAALTFPLDPALREPRRPDAPRPEHSHQDAENDSDWEYEYDEHETETFYLTLDVGASSASRQAQHKAPPKNRRAGADADQADSLDIEDAPTERPIAEATAKDDEDPDRHRIQMLDLHTTQPLISYQNQFYTAQWASTIGTDLFFTAPSSSETTHPTLLRTPQFDVLATSTTRLLATPATLKPRPDVATSPTHEPPNPPTDSDDIVIPVGTGASEGRIQQARFLEQLIRAKRARGESDEVTVHARRVMTGTGWRTQNRLLDQRGTLRDGQGAGRASAAHNADEYESENENENGDGDDEPMDEELAPRSSKQTPMRN